MSQKREHFLGGNQDCCAQNIYDWTTKRNESRFGAKAKTEQNQNVILLFARI